MPIPAGVRAYVLRDTAFDAECIRAACAERGFSWIVPVNPERVLAGRTGRRRVRSLVQDFTAKDFEAYELQPGRGDGRMHRPVVPILGGAAAEPGDLAEPVASSELCRGLPLRAPPDRPAEEAAGPAEHREVGLSAGGVPGVDPRSDSRVHHLEPVRSESETPPRESQLADDGGGPPERAGDPVRQRIARLLLERVVVVVDKASERVDVSLHWVGGDVQSHTLARPVRRYDQHSEYPRLTARLRALCGQRRPAAAIAEQLNAEGFHPPKRTTRFTRGMVLRLIGLLGLGRREPHGSAAGLGPNEYRPAGLAERLGINRDTVRRWIRVGWVHVRRDENGHHVIWADAGERRRLRELHRLPRTWAHKARLNKLTKPGPRPAR